jgi:molybdopterin molybdotransferase
MPANVELFNLQSPEEAWQRLCALWHPVLRRESIATEAALGRVLASAVHAAASLPEFRRSTVDGYALRAQDTYGASPGLPALLAIAGEAAMGADVTLALSEGACALVHTGSMLPPDADAVVMVEHTQPAGVAQLEVMRPLAVGDNVLQVGEDIVAGAQAYAPGVRLRPQDIGALMALGQTRVEVVYKPLTGIISTGDEVIAPEVAPGPGQVRDVNSYALAALVDAHGGIAKRYGIVPDQRSVLHETLARAWVECDIVVVSAGSSVSARDMSVEAIEALGAPGVLAHGIAIKPGKPAILALCDGKPVFGLPGNPASALAVAQLFLVPALDRMLGARARRPHVVRARLTRNVPSAAGRLDIVPVNLFEHADGLLAAPVFGKSNLIYTLVRADGRIEIPMHANGLREGEWVDVFVTDI